jgi:hypothetical protein
MEKYDINISLSWLKGWEKLLRNKVLSKVYKFEA